MIQIDYLSIIIIIIIYTFLILGKFIYTDLSTNEGIVVCSKFENNLHQNTSTKFIVHCEPIRKTPIIFTCDGTLLLFFVFINTYCI